MSNNMEHTPEDDRGGDVAARRPDNSPAPSTDIMAVRVVRILAGILLVILGFRFVLALVGANAANGFVNAITVSSWPFAAPFYGMFASSSRFELYTLFAMAVYVLVAWGLMHLLRIRRPAAA